MNKKINIQETERIAILRQTIGFLSNELVKSYVIIRRLNHQNGHLLKQLNKQQQVAIKNICISHTDFLILIIVLSSVV